MSPCLHAEMMFCFLAQEDEYSIVYLTVIDILLHHKQLKKIFQVHKMKKEMER